MSKKPKKPAPESPKPPGVTRAQLVQTLRSKFGDAVIPTYDSKAKQEFIVTGSYALDDALGGGWARGRVSEVWGSEGISKSTLLLHAIASAQRAGLAGALIDAEHALHPEYAVALGVDMDALAWIRPDTMEQAYETTDALVDSGQYAFVGFDSVAATDPAAVLEGDYEAAEMGARARLTGKHMRYIQARAAKTNSHVMYLNQVRQKIGVIFGSPNTTTGGNALKFFSSQRVSLSKAENGKLMDGTTQVGQRVCATVVKNRLARPFQEAEYDIIFGSGIDAIGDLRDAALESRLLVMEAGGWFHRAERETGETFKIAQGRNGLRLKLEEDEELRAALVADLAAVRAMR